MSGPRPRMGGYHIMFKIHAPALLCQQCDPSPGWGWYIENHWVSNPGQLPPPGNGFDVDGTCKHCDGIGVDRMGRFNAGRPDKLGMGGYCEDCNGRGTTFTHALGTSYYTIDDDGKSDAVHSSCERCAGTGRDALPWAELFKDECT